LKELVSRITQRLTKVVEPQAPAMESRPEPSTAAGAEEPAAAQAEEEAPVKAEIVDIASILCAPTVTVIRSSLYVKTFPE
jgi:hypothetical protein